MHVDYEDVHDIYEEHKPLYEVTQSKTIKERVQGLRYLFKGKQQPES